MGKFGRSQTKSRLSVNRWRQRSPGLAGWSAMGRMRLLQLGLPATPPTNPPTIPAAAEMAGEFMLRVAGLDITRCPHWTYSGAPTDG